MARRDEERELTREERKARMHGGSRPVAVEVALAPPPAPPSDHAELANYQPGDQVILRARPGFWNYTFGPALYYRGPRSIDEIYRAGEPVVVVADMIPLPELRKLEISHIRGFVFEEGSAVDEELYNFLQTEKRAAVLGCKYACYFAREGGWVIVDGVQGMVCFNPTDKTLESFQAVRAKGPPKQERMEAVMNLLGDMVTAAAEQREQQKAEGTYDDPHDHHLTPKQAVQVQQEAPGLILQLLAGLPIKGVPDAEAAGYEEPEAEGGADAASAAVGAKPQTAAERRVARAKGGRHDRGHDHGHDHEHDHEHADDAPAGGGGPASAAPDGEAKAGGKKSAADRKAEREQEQQRTRDERGKA